VIAKGELEVQSIAGTTNGTLYSKGAEVTVVSTAFGVSAVCKTGASTALGTLTGAEAGGQAVIHINSKISCGILGTSTLTGAYVVTNPTGFVVETIPDPGTELYKNTGSGTLDTLGTGTEITATLQPGTSLLLKDSAGTSTDTCTGSEIKGKIESAGGEASHPSGKVSTLSFSSCGHTTKVLANGELEVKSIAGTTNGTVYSKGAEVTVVSTAFGVSAVCKAGTGTALGILTGAGAGEQAVIHINGKIPCGILGVSTLTGAYVGTNPTGLVVEAQ
jgi:peroxiredoxin family protein